MYIQKPVFLPLLSLRQFISVPFTAYSSHVDGIFHGRLFLVPLNRENNWLIIIINKTNYEPRWTVLLKRFIYSPAWFAVNSYIVQCCLNTMEHLFRLNTFFIFEAFYYSSLSLCVIRLTDVFLNFLLCNSVDMQSSVAYSIRRCSCQVRSE